MNWIDGTATSGGLPHHTRCNSRVRRSGGRGSCRAEAHRSTGNRWKPWANAQRLILYRGPGHPVDPVKQSEDRINMMNRIDGTPTSCGLPHHTRCNSRVRHSGPRGSCRAEAHQSAGNRWKPWANAQRLILYRGPGHPVDHVDPVTQSEDRINMMNRIDGTATSGGLPHHTRCNSRVRRSGGRGSCRAEARRSAGNR